MKSRKDPDPRKWPKEWRPIFQAATDQGWTVKLLRGGHWCLLAPDGEGRVVMGKSTGSGPSRARRQTLARMRKHGFEWSGR